VIAESAVIHPSAQIAPDVEIGPYSIVGPNVSIDSGTWIGPHVVINGPARIGKNNKVFQFVSLGESPQDKRYNGEPTELIIGDRNIIRESATIHRGSSFGAGKTIIGNDNYFMAYTHVAHDCVVGNFVTFANNASISGHVTVGDYATLGGMVGIHQYCRIGNYSFCGGGSIVLKDVTPFVIVSGYPAETHGLNTIGLERHGFNPDIIAILRKSYKILFRKSFMLTQAIQELTHMMDKPIHELQLLIDFLKHSSRGIVR
jgi:UDP-N-acetylglucosamine acyltransferase